MRFARMLSNVETLRNSEVVLADLIKRNRLHVVGVYTIRNRPECHLVRREVCMRLKAEGALVDNCRHRPVPYLNNVLEQDHRTIKRRVELGEMTAGFRFRFRSGHLQRRHQAQLSCLRADREAARRRPGD
jgi:hypothetical protein